MRTLTAEAAEGLIVNIVNVEVVMVDAGTLSRVSLFCQLPRFKTALRTSHHNNVRRSGQQTGTCLTDGIG